MDYNPYSFAYIEMLLVCMIACSIEGVHSLRSGVATWCLIYCFVNWSHITLPEASNKLQPLSCRIESFSRIPIATDRGKTTAAEGPHNKAH